MKRKALLAVALMLGSLAAGCPSPRSEGLSPTPVGPPPPDGSTGPRTSDPASGTADAAADVTAGPAAECNAGETRCAAAGAAVEVCTVSGHWLMKQACESVCRQGVCAGKCTPGVKQCGASQSSEVCNDQGEWSAGPPCEFACMGEGLCGGECRPGARRCGGINQLVVETCDEKGTWVPGAVCPNVCGSGSCGGSCMPGKKRCGANRVPELCSPQGTWEPSGEACPFVCAGEGVCGGECRPSSNDCEGLTPRNCNDAGDWVEKPACPFVCSNGGCTGNCKPGQKTCSGKIPQLCDDTGTYRNQTPCRFVCAEGNCAGTCEPRSRECSGDTPQVCDDTGTYRNEPACQFVCTDGNCSGSCEPQRRQCSGNTPQVCDNTGTYRNQTPCPRGCAAGNCCTGNTEASGGNCATCGTQGQPCCQIASPACTGGLVCGANGRCQQPCGPGQPRCCPGQSESCSASCGMAGQRSCDSSGTRGPCLPQLQCCGSESKCRNTTVQVCQNGTFVDRPRTDVTVDSDQIITCGPPGSNPQICSTKMFVPFSVQGSCPRRVSFSATTGPAHCGPVRFTYRIGNRFTGESGFIGASTTDNENVGNLPEGSYTLEITAQGQLAPNCNDGQINSWQAIVEISVRD